MRRLWLSLALLAALFGASLWNTACVTDTTRAIARQLDAAEEAAAREDWAAAEEKFVQAQALWTKAEGYFSIVLCHGDTDEVSTGFEEVSGFLQYRDAPEFDSAGGTLTAKVEHLAEIEALNWRNLL